MTYFLKKKKKKLKEWAKITPYSNLCDLYSTSGAGKAGKTHGIHAEEWSWTQHHVQKIGPPI